MERNCRAYFVFIACKDACDVVCAVWGDCDAATLLPWTGWAAASALSRWPYANAATANKKKHLTIWLDRAMLPLTQVESRLF